MTLQIPTIEEVDEAMRDRGDIFTLRARKPLGYTRDAELILALAAGLAMQPQRGRAHREPMPETVSLDEVMAKPGHNPEAAARYRAERLSRKAANRAKRGG